MSSSQACVRANLHGRRTSISPSGQIRIGISGWRYAAWRGDFYPSGLPQRRELEYAASQFDSIEINGSFYSLQRPESYANWYAQTPAGFVFAVKGGRYITHLLALRNVERALANFFASGVLCLEDKLGPILWQFPARLGFDARFESFIEQLPRDTLQAAALARRHDAHLRGRSWTRVGARRRLRHAFEVRHPSFACPEFLRLLRRHNVALVSADAAGSWSEFQEVTADFTYVRLHGDTELYSSGYGPAALRRWAQRIRDWQAGREGAAHSQLARGSSRHRHGRDVYVYFDNDGRGRAPHDALALRRLLDASTASGRAARQGSPAFRNSRSRTPSVGVSTSSSQAMSGSGS